VRCGVKKTPLPGEILGLQNSHHALATGKGATNAYVSGLNGDTRCKKKGSEGKQSGFTEIPLWKASILAQARISKLAW